MVRKLEGRERFLAVSVAVTLWVTGGANPVLGQTPSIQGSKPRLILTIQVCNTAGVSFWTLGEAEKEAARILREAEVETIWLDCPPAGVELAKKPGSHQDAGPADFSLRILKQVPPERPTFRYDTLGFALPCSEGARGCLAYLSYPRVEELATHVNAALSQILGHAMAHEIGHLLLGPTHTSSGIMKAKWDRRDLQRAAWQQLGFTLQQAEIIRAGVLARGKVAQISSRQHEERDLSNGR